MKQYSRVSYVVRCQIDALLQAKISIPEIADQLGYHKSSIYRELKRNQGIGSYTPFQAQSLANYRYRRCRKNYTVTLDVKDFIRNKLKEDWSPEQISGRLRKENGFGPSHQTIYNVVKLDFEMKQLLKGYQKRGGGRYRQRRAIWKEGSLRIHQRPRIANERKRLGDWERDTMHTKDGVQVLVCTDRKSRFTKIAKVETRNNREIGRLTLELIKSTNKKAYTITNDNGADFKANVDIGIKTYFCDPMKPQQRGTVENTIGLLRSYIQRKTDIKDYKEEEFLKIENKINLRPRKVLDYKTPYEVYFKKKVALAILI